MRVSPDQVTSMSIATPTNQLRWRCNILEQAWRYEEIAGSRRRRAWIEWRRVEDVPADAPMREGI